MLQPTPDIPRKKKKRGMWIAILAVVLTVAALAVVWIVKHRAPPITVQTTKVSRHSLTNLVVANGQIQPVVQVTISPEVSGEIIELPVKEGQLVQQGRFARENQSGCLCRGGRTRPRPVMLRRWPAMATVRSQSRKRPRRITSAIWNCSTANCFRNRTLSGSRPRAPWPAPSWKAPTTR